MPTQVTMPQLGESVVEGTITKWLVKEGEPVKKYDPLLEVATDKVDTEVPSPADGVLLKIYVAEGETVQVGTLIAAIGEPGEALPEGPTTEAAPATPSGDGQTAAEAKPAAAEAPSDLGFISPVVAKLAAEHNVDLSKVKGTGLKGRIRKKDVLAYIEQREKEAAAEPALAPWEQPGTGELFKPTPPLTPTEPATARAPAATALQEGDRVAPLSRMRRLIAEHMVQSKRTSPHVTTVFDCDMTAVVRHLYAKRDSFARDGVTLTFTPYFIAAIVAALKKHPYANSSWSEEGIVLHRDINVGMAVAIDDGLIVPVIKQADSLNLLGLARAVNDLAQRGRAGKLKPDELQGGTFTLTNHGVSGSLFATPIINQPQTGILGVGKIHKAPVVVSRGHALLPDADDAIVIRPIVYLSFSFDHRVLDGATADAFVASVKEKLENWS
ncbi:MAG: 2-oxo acid dehydrogenase subunit E2 [Chloroflexi bacterium]|nr:2-oxo acid dehydrogenase subunit E2 [Chloroflexota bacterium]